MSNVHKSKEGWRRYRSRGKRVRDFEPPARHSAGKPVSKRIDPPEVPPARQEKLRNRRRVVI